MRNLLNTPVIRGLAVFALAFGLLSQTGASAQTKLKVAYIPIMPMAQLFVMEGEGWTKEAGLELELTKFSSGPGHRIGQFRRDVFRHRTSHGFPCPGGPDQGRGQCRHRTDRGDHPR